MPPPKIHSTENFKGHELRVHIVGTGFIGIALKGATELARSEGTNAENILAALRRAVLEHDPDYIGFKSAMALFLRGFPGGFNDLHYLNTERKYKVDAHIALSAILSKNGIDEFISNGTESEAILRIAKHLTELLSPRFEASPLKKFVIKDSKKFLRILGKFLYSSDAEEAFSDFVQYLRREDLAKWPIITYFPFCLDPVNHVFVKPDYITKAAARLAFKLEYASPPTFASYCSAQAFFAHLKNGIVELDPRDNIDLHTFVFTLGHKGYINALENERAPR